MNAALTPLGKLLRKLRIDHGERLIDVANALDISTSMLSAIELGRKSVPGEFIEGVIRHYELDLRAVEALKQAAAESAPLVRINLQGAPESARHLATAFARRFQALDKKEIDEMLEVLHRKRTEGSNE